MIVLKQGDIVILKSGDLCKVVEVLPPEKAATEYVVYIEGINTSFGEAYTIDGKEWSRDHDNSLDVATVLNDDNYLAKLVV